MHRRGARSRRWLGEMQGEDLEFFELKSAADIPSKCPLSQDLGPHAKLKASMLQDLEKGRECEINYINGVICQQAERAVYQLRSTTELLSLSLRRRLDVALTTSVT